LPVSDTQKAYISETLFCDYAIATSDGECELFKPLTDDDHRDISLGRRGKGGALYVQVKMATGLDDHGYVRARADFHGEPPSGGWLLYAIVLLPLPEVRIERSWLIPCDEMNRLAGRSRRQPDLTQLNFYARPDGDDRFAAFRVDSREIGPRLLYLLAASDPTRLPYRPGELVALRAR
jgi:hypothetical protein